MGIVIEAFIGIGVIIALIWVLWLQAAVARDREQARRAAREEEERTRLLESDKRRYTAREPLRCLSCDLVFDGPLTADGCPTCHHEALVIIDSEYWELGKSP